MTTDPQMSPQDTVLQAIEEYRRQRIGLNRLIQRIDPVIDGIQPESVWDEASDLCAELDAFYGLVATDTVIREHGHDFPLSAQQESNVDRILAELSSALRHDTELARGLEHGLGLFRRGNRRQG